MAWIESHEELWDHHKTYRLCAAVNQPDYAVVGRLISLWHFVLKNAWKDANLEPWGDEAIERASRWDGEKGVWVRALRDCGFLDGFVVHGWQKRAGRLVQDRRRNELRKHRRTTGGKTAVKRTHATGKPLATVPNPTLPNLTKPKEKTKDSAPNDTAPPPPTPAVKPLEVVPPERRTNKPVHVEFVERFKVAYEQAVGAPFKYDQKDFVVAKRLIDQYGLAAVLEKVQTLFVMCRDGTTWFSRGGWSDFSIGKLSSQWNSIIPEAVPRTKDQEFMSELRRQGEMRERTNRALNG